MVARVLGAAHLDVLGDARSPLRLVRDVANGGRLSAETIERTLRIVRGFVAVASSAGAERTVAVATAAVREASNGEEFIERARAASWASRSRSPTATRKRVSGFYGAVHGLPVEHGIVLDVGRRQPAAGPLPRRGGCSARGVCRSGALRLNDRFLQVRPADAGRDAQPQGARVRARSKSRASARCWPTSAWSAPAARSATWPKSIGACAASTRSRGCTATCSIAGDWTTPARCWPATPASDRARVPGLNGDRVGLDRRRRAGRAGGHGSLAGVRADGGRLRPARRRSRCAA